MRRSPSPSRKPALGVSVLGRVLAAALVVMAGLIWLLRGAERPRPTAAFEAPEPAAVAEEALASAPAALPLDAGSPATRQPPASPKQVLPRAATTSAELARAYELLRSSDLRVRFEGLRLLAELRPGEAVPEIVAFVAATREEERVLLQRLAAVALLGTLEGVSTEDELVALYEGGDEGVRRAAACALDRRGDPALVAREILALRGDLGSPDAGVRARAVAAVAGLASRAAVPHLLPFLDDPDSAVRMQAIDGLLQADDPTVLPELERMRADPIELVRARAERALRALRSSAEARGH